MGESGRVARSDAADVVPSVVVGILQTRDLNTQERPGKDNYDGLYEVCTVSRTKG